MAGGREGSGAGDIATMAGARGMSADGNEALGNEATGRVAAGVEGFASAVDGRMAGLAAGGGGAGAFFGRKAGIRKRGNAAPVSSTPSSYSSTLAPVS